jgi:hypothetical protein
MCRKGAMTRFNREKVKRLLFREGVSARLAILATLANVSWLGVHNVPVVEVGLDTTYPTMQR